MAMSKAQKNSLVTNRVYLLNSILPGEEFYSYLRADNHMTESMQQEIMVCTQCIYMNIKQQSSHCFSLYLRIAQCNR